MKKARLKNILFFVYSIGIGLIWMFGVIFLKILLMQGP
jgi:hypothetical protein